ncbi:hypothetical protein K1719_030442 [Acacia pycnantha]|nr:hypothetical protein K1719_030442 [Acacia pycnantha]
MNAGTQSIGGDGNVRWRSVPFMYPSTLDTIAMEIDLKNKVKSDLESFLKAKQYYQRLGQAELESGEPNGFDAFEIQKILQDLFWS